MAVRNLNTKPITKLSGMRISEISLVDDGASPGADVILMKRHEVDDAVSEAIELLKRGKSGFNADEPRDERGRWVHEAVNLLRQGVGRAKETINPATRQAVSLLQEGGRYLRDTLPTEVGSGVRTAAIALHSHAKTAANAVAEHVNNALGTGVHAIKNTQVTAVRPVAGGGVQFSFKHDLGSAGSLKTHVQVRPEHVSGAAGEHALKTLHRYLASREDLTTEQPFVRAEGGEGLDWFRYSHTPQLFQEKQPLGLNSEKLPYPRTEQNRHGIDQYYWQGKQEPEWVAEARRYYGQGDGTPEKARGQAFVSRNNGKWIPAMRPDVQKHAVRVYDQIRSHPNGAEKQRMMVRDNPTYSGGNG